MLKYTDTQVVFAEVPDEITLAINISGCPNNCEGCHSPHLRSDIGTPLKWDNLNTLLYINKGITCVAFMGGDNAPSEINKLAYNVKRLGLKTCWYSGRLIEPEYIDINNFDYIKLGPYIKDRGPLDNPNTNQRFYHIEKGEWKDITYKFWKNVQTENKDKAI